MVLKRVATADAALPGVAELPSPPPVIRTAMVLRHCESAVISLFASDFRSVSRFDNGASTRPLPSLPAGRIAPAVVNVLLSSVTMSVLAVVESAWIFATGEGAAAAPLSAVTFPLVKYH